MASVGYVYTRDHLPRAFLCDRAVIACEWNVECLGGFEGCGERRTEPVLVEGSGGSIPELTIKGGLFLPDHGVSVSFSVATRVFQPQPLLLCTRNSSVHSVGRAYRYILLYSYFKRRLQFLQVEFVQCCGADINVPDALGKRCVGYVYTRDHLPRAFLCDCAVIACEWNVECLGGFEGCGERRTEPVLVVGSVGCIPELTIKGGLF
ncbi:hypothetical protein NDU88_002484 [Pleurodeles waltl]|uniref:Uncharacterized protein n=1 Tax=Pleurodeles waltl TaxID=8319 RepID=A0AAV7KSC3_PLEWA|nr:hypothetical protein NDU88_002484 [Pleurodeles waltl]